MRHLWLLLILMLLCCACNEEEVTDAISHKQANEILCVLGEQGIPASIEKKGRGKGDNYYVKVKRNRVLEALNVLREKGLFEESDELSEQYKNICKEGGLFAVHTAEDSAMCADRVLELKIESNLKEMVGVISAKASVRQKTAKDASDESVHVSLKTRGENKISEEDAKKLIKGIVPNIDENRIAVSLSYIASTKQQFSLVGMNSVNGEVIVKPLVPFLGYWSIPESDFSSLSISISVALFLALLIGAVTGYMLSLMKRRTINSDETDVSEIVTFRDDTVTHAGKEI